MKFASLKLCLAVASAAFVLAGCSKKPLRPDPSMTMMGQTPGGAGSNLGGTVGDASFGQTPPPGLTDRGAGFDPNGQNREALRGSTVYFEFDQSAIRPGERDKLRLAKEYLDQNPTHRLLLEGHADWRGTAEYNLSLGDRRANSVKRYLQSIGVAPERLDTVSKGSLEAAKNADAATMEKDRRVDLIVVDPASAMPVSAASTGPVL
jgi:peptidoglycan-associated lipoprotein